MLKAPAALGAATVKILDHHRVPIAARTVSIRAGETVVPLRSRKQVGAVYLQIGAFRDWIVADSYGGVHGELGPAPAEPE